jgi:23S rRNA pseudouridine1911/1915/1917 synthase
MTGPSAHRPGTRRITVSIPRALRGGRLDQALASLITGQSRAALQRLIREGRVTVAGAPGRASYQVRGGEKAVIDLPPIRSSTLEPEARALDILYEDDDLLVLNKPMGLTVHPGAGRAGGTLVNALLHHGRGLSHIGGTERPGIVHRLDRDTSGVMVVAKHDQAHRELAAQFKARRVRKSYEALVWGRPRAPAGLIDAPVGRHKSVRVRMAVRPDGRASRTRYQVAEELGPLTLLVVHPETGRTHQIRVHLSSIGHPIVGDRLYAGVRAVIRETEIGAILASYEGLALHARSLGFNHPRSGRWREFEAPRPAGLDRLLGSLRTVDWRPAASRRIQRGRP